MALKKLSKEDIIDTIHVTEVSEETGEIIEYTKAKYTEKGQEKIDNNRKYKASEKECNQYMKEEFGNFFFYFYNKLDDYNIKPQYKTRLLILASYLDYDSSILVNKNERNIKLKLNKDNIRDILKLSDSEFRKTMKALLDNNCITKDGRNYLLNTNVVKKGELPKKTNKEYTRVFVNTIRELYWSVEPTKHKQLYYIFKMLPLTNLQFNIPCTDTTEETMKNIQPLTIHDISELIGYGNKNGNKLWNMLRGFRINENYVICKIIFDKTECIVINPSLFYAGSQIENLKFIVDAFKMASSTLVQK